MQEGDEFWDFYWEVRLRDMDDLGKREAILAGSQLIRRMAADPRQTVRLLELGCGEGQIIGSLFEAHADVPGIDTSLGIDYSGKAIAACRRLYPRIHFIQGDFTDHELISGLGRFEIVLLVNALHEVFSAGYSADLGEVDVEPAKQAVAQALAGAAGCLSPGSRLVLFDGLENSGDIHAPVRIRFQHIQARRRFEIFASEYQPFHIRYRNTTDPFVVEMSYHDFTRYIDKSIFLEKRLWQTERLESYQYFNETEFRQAFARLDLVIEEFRTLTVNYEKWRSEVEIETPGLDFPTEHILITAQRASEPRTG